MKLGDTKTERDKYRPSQMNSYKIKGRSVKGNFRRVTFIREVMQPLVQKCPVYKGKQWQYTLQCTQRAYKRVRTFA